MTPNTAKMMESLSEETYYDLLRITPSATTAEIVNAYHAAKNAFSKDSIAIYSLFDNNDTQSILSKLEEAYLTLSNLEKRRDYDRRLNQKNLNNNDEENSTMSTSPFSPKPAELNTFETTAPNRSVSSANPTLPMADSNEASTPTPRATGSLIALRESRGLSVEDVARITKIPPKFLSAIENFDIPRLPAKVYIQGFLKNLSQLYRIDAKETVQQYLTELESRTPAKPN